METETIDKLYLYNNQEFKTIDEILMFMFPLYSRYCEKETYYDEQCTELQGGWKRRSIEDLHIICKTYFPDTSLLDVLKAIQRCNLNFYICDDIDKLVFHRVDYAGVTSFNLFNLEAYMVRHDAYLSLELDLKDSCIEIVNLLKKEEEQCLEKNSLELEVV